MIKAWRKTVADMFPGINPDSKLITVAMIMLGATFIYLIRVI